MHPQLLYPNSHHSVSCILFQAELVALRHDLVEERAAKQVLEKEVNNLLLQLHAVQLQLHSNTGMPLDSENIKNKLVSNHKWLLHEQIFLAFFSLTLEIMYNVMLWVKMIYIQPRLTLNLLCLLTLTIDDPWIKIIYCSAVPILRGRSIIAKQFVGLQETDPQSSASSSVSLLLFIVKSYSV